MKVEINEIRPEGKSFSVYVRFIDSEHLLNPYCEVSVHFEPREISNLTYSQIRDRGISNALDFLIHVLKETPRSLI